MRQNFCRHSIGIFINQYYLWFTRDKLDYELAGA